MARLSRFGTRALVIAIGGASALSGAIAGCGIDDMGSLVFGDDAGENVGASLPDGSDVDGASDGGRDALGDNDVPVIAKCTSSTCVAMGGTCDGTGTCVIHCDDAGTCEAGAICPPNVPCRVSCGLGKSCPLVDCTQAQSCDITCAGKDSCGTVACGGDHCTLGCNGDDTCSDGGVTCTAKICAIDCAGGGSTCGGPVKCTGDACTVRCTKKDSCKGGVDVYATDAQVSCVDNACTGGVSCLGGKNCTIACKGGSCNGTTFCCDASVCSIDAGTNACP